MNASGATSEGSAAETLHVMIMNASGKTAHGNAKKRKNAIVECIRTLNPDLVLFQEFGQNSEWLTSIFPDYNYDGHKEASIFYKKDKLNVEKIKAQDLRDISQQFTAIDRISVHIIVSKKHIPDFNFGCLSWHGRNITKTKFDDYGSLLELAEDIYDEYELPILLGGDFNINWHDIHKNELFRMDYYTASERREAVGVKDFFLITESLDLSCLKPENLNEESSAVLDHDPVSGELKQTEMSDRARNICALLNELEAWTKSRPTYPRTTSQLEMLTVQHEEEKERRAEILRHEFQCLCNIEVE